jgi:hypothetical protein
MAKVETHSVGANAGRLPTEQFKRAGRALAGEGKDEKTIAEN